MKYIFVFVYIYSPISHTMFLCKLHKSGSPLDGWRSSIEWTNGLVNRKMGASFSSNMQLGIYTMIHDKTLQKRLTVFTLRKKLSMYICLDFFFMLSDFHYFPQDTCLFLFITRKSVSQCPMLSSFQILPPQGPQKHPCRKVPSWSVWWPIITLVGTLFLCWCSQSALILPLLTRP